MIIQRYKIIKTILNFRRKTKVTNTNLNLRGLIGNEYYNMVELKNDIILAFNTEEEVIVYNVSNNVIKAYIDSQEDTEYNILTEEMDGLTVVMEIEKL